VGGMNPGDCRDSDNADGACGGAAMRDDSVEPGMLGPKASGLELVANAGQGVSEGRGPITLAVQITQGTATCFDE